MENKYYLLFSFYFDYLEKRRKCLITQEAQVTFALDSAAVGISLGEAVFLAIWTEWIVHTSEIAHQQNHIWPYNGPICSDADLTLLHNLLIVYLKAVALVFHGIQHTFRSKANRSSKNSANKQ